MSDIKRGSSQKFNQENNQKEKLQKTPEFFADKLADHNTSYKIAKSSYGKYIDFTGAFHILPDFLIIGAVRAGSTSLYEGLKTHPNVFGSKIKEIYFFDANFHRGVNWYKRFFPSKWKKFQITKIHKKKFLTGEATPHYISYSHAPKRVFNLIPNVKLIVILRNPIDRAYSQYQSRVSAGTEPLSFDDAIKKEDIRLENVLKKMEEDENYIHNNFFRYSYLHHGIYVNGLRKWMETFPKNQFLILKAEEFYQKPAIIFESIQKFLGLPKFHPANYAHYNLGKYDDMNTETRKFLHEFFKPYNEELYKFLGRDFGWETQN